MHRISLAVLRYLYSPLVAVLIACSPTSGGAKPEPVTGGLPGLSAKAVELDGVENLHQVSPVLYRSGQPTPKGFSQLQQLGVRSVLNLREYHKDTRRAAHTNLQLMAYPVAAGAVTETDVENCLRLLINAPKPVLVHCWHGSDRTGIVVAAWRIVMENRNIAEAEAEFRNDIYGHHEFWYGNLVELLRTTDWDAMRERLKVAQ
ncbi:MAG: tyrosine-protein phosphatase [Akkermansia sp.]|nr:tyrosine-protein phosphatase [Akkermansia sp.]